MMGFNCLITGGPASACANWTSNSLMMVDYMPCEKESKFLDDFLFSLWMLSVFEVQNCEKFKFAPLYQQNNQFDCLFLCKVLTIYCLFRAWHVFRGKIRATYPTVVRNHCEYETTALTRCTWPWGLSTSIVSPSLRWTTRQRNEISSLTILSAYKFAGARITHQYWIQRRQQTNSSGGKRASKFPYPIVLKKSGGIESKLSVYTRWRWLSNLGSSLIILKEKCT